MYRSMSRGGYDSAGRLSLDRFRISADTHLCHSWFPRDRLRVIETFVFHQVAYQPAGTGRFPLVAALQHEGVALQTRRITTGEEKAAYVEALGPEHIVALGNGVNDVGMFQRARLSIAICGPEGLAKEALQAATLVVATPETALDLLLHPRRLTATLRP